MPYLKVKPIIDKNVISLCIRSYYNHLKGCPNFGKNDRCPPKAGYIENNVDLSKQIYAIYNVFNFSEHIKNMLEKHPSWSKRQVECCLYWQGKARKQLKKEVKKFLIEFPNYKIIDTPEAQGVNVTQTMKNVGIILQFPPKTITYQIVLAGDTK